MSINRSTLKQLLQRRVRATPDTPLDLSGVYILQARRPYVAKSGHRRKTASRYVGFAADIAERLLQHRGRCGARLTEIWVIDGIEFDVAVIIPGASRSDERLIKRSGHYDRWVF